MKLPRDLGELNLDDVRRCWLAPRELCALTGLVGRDAEQDRIIHKYLNNLTTRGYLPHDKSGPMRTHRRLHSLVSAVMFRTFFEITKSHRPYNYAAPIAEQVKLLLEEAVTQLPHSDDMWDRLDGWRVVYWQRANSDRPPVARPWRSPTIPDDGPLDVGVFAAGYLLCRVIEEYVSWLEAEGRQQR
ncbi:MAG: hypothetical protein ACLFU0_00865 [Alphaproteobacteria bacterium]